MTAITYRTITTPCGEAYKYALPGETLSTSRDVRAAGIHDRAAPSPVQLRRISDAVRTLARRHRMHPRDMQALLWIRARGSAY
jgi:penicillin V acylase-like amidase (Ntn superfamily)